MAFRDFSFGGRFGGRVDLQSIICLLRPSDAKERTKCRNAFALSISKFEPLSTVSFSPLVPNWRDAHRHPTVRWTSSQHSTRPPRRNRIRSFASQFIKADSRVKESYRIISEDVIGRIGRNGSSNVERFSYERVRYPMTISQEDAR